jgi:hypothetical protein
MQNANAQAIATSTSTPDAQSRLQALERYVVKGEPVIVVGC